MTRHDLEELIRIYHLNKGKWRKRFSFISKNSVITALEDILASEIVQRCGLYDAIPEEAQQAILSLAATHDLSADKLHAGEKTLLLAKRLITHSPNVFRQRMTNIILHKPSPIIRQHIQELFASHPVKPLPQQYQERVITHVDIDHAISGSNEYPIRLLSDEMQLALLADHDDQEKHHDLENHLYGFQQCVIDLDWHPVPKPAFAGWQLKQLSVEDHGEGLIQLGYQDETDQYFIRILRESSSSEHRTRLEYKYKQIHPSHMVDEYLDNNAIKEDYVRMCAEINFSRPQELRALLEPIRESSESERLIFLQSLDHVMKTMNQDSVFCGLRDDRRDLLTRCLHYKQGNSKHKAFILLAICPYLDLTGIIVDNKIASMFYVKINHDWTFIPLEQNNRQFTIISLGAIAGSSAEDALRAQSNSFSEELPSSPTPATAPRRHRINSSHSPSTVSETSEQVPDRTGGDSAYAGSPTSPDTSWTGISPGNAARVARFT